MLGSFVREWSSYEVVSARLKARHLKFPYLARRDIRVQSTVNIHFSLDEQDSALQRRRTGRKYMIQPVQKTDLSAHVSFPTTMVVGTSPEGHEEACATTDRRRGGRPLLGAGVLNPSRGSVA